MEDELIRRVEFGRLQSRPRKSGLRPSFLAFGYDFDLGSRAFGPPSSSLTIEMDVACPPRCIQARTTTEATAISMRSNSDLQSTTHGRGHGRQELRPTRDRTTTAGKKGGRKRKQEPHIGKVSTSHSPKTLNTSSTRINQSPSKDQQTECPAPRRPRTRHKS